MIKGNLCPLGAQHLVDGLGQPVCPECARSLFLLTEAQKRIGENALVLVAPRRPDEHGDAFVVVSVGQAMRLPRGDAPGRRIFAVRQPLPVEPQLYQEHR